MTNHQYETTVKRLADMGHILPHPSRLDPDLFPGGEIPDKVWGLILREYSFSQGPQDNIAIVSMYGYKRGIKDIHTFNHLDFPKLMNATLERGPINYMATRILEDKGKYMFSEDLKGRVTYSKIDGESCPWLEHLTLKTMNGFRSAIFPLEYSDYLLEFWTNYELCWNRFGQSETNRNILLVQAQMLNKKLHNYQLISVFNSAEYAIPEIEV